MPEGGIAQDNKWPEAESHIIPIEKMPEYDYHPG
jgi:hypothetical protein